MILLEEIGVDSCKVNGRSNHYTVGPSVACVSGTNSLGMGYRWDKDYVPYLEFFTFHYSTCKTCEQSFHLLKNIGYSIDNKSEPLEVIKQVRFFSNNTLGKVKIEVWNECSSGKRLKIFRSIVSGLK